MSPHPVEKTIVDARNWPVNGGRIPAAQAADVAFSFTIEFIIRNTHCAASNKNRGC
jgi:hypothetical protein